MNYNWKIFVGKMGKFSKNGKYGKRVKWENGKN